MSFVLAVHLAATWALVGLIWMVQLVHYPLFARVGRERFPAYEADHQRRIGWLVAVLMPAEALTGLWLVVAPVGVSPVLAWIGLALIGVVWASTAFWQGPMHPRLREGFDPDLHRRLVTTNWVRTAAWTLRGLVVLAMLF